MELGYFKRQDIPVHFSIAASFTVADMYQVNFGDNPLLQNDRGVNNADRKLPCPVLTQTELLG
jgi:hypothetical protein